MGKTLSLIVVSGCSLAMASFSWGQMKQKPGLWEVTSTVSMAGMPQMPAMPPGVHMPQMASPFAPHTTQVCVTQAMIDKYGGPYSNPPHGDCKVTDIVMKPDGMTAKIICSGSMDATGTIDSTWTQADTTHTTMHMTGTMQMGQNSQPLDMTVKADSAYKGPDCGNVKPLQIPAEKE